MDDITNGLMVFLAIVILMASILVFNLSEGNSVLIVSGWVLVGCSLTILIGMYFINKDNNGENMYL